MKQPILFQSRIIDLAEITEKMFGEVLPSNGNVPHALALRLTCGDKGTGVHAHMCKLLMDEYGIDFSKLKYKRLERPYAVDKLTGDFYPVIEMEYTNSGMLSGVILRPESEATLYFWVNKDCPDARFYTERRIADIEILHDGWFE